MTTQFTLHFTKAFTTGILAGLEYADTLGVTSEEAAHKAVENFNSLSERNGWTVKEYTVKTR